LAKHFGAVVEELQIEVKKNEREKLAIQNMTCVGIETLEVDL